MSERDREPKEPEAPGGRRPAIVWCDRSFCVRCARCDGELHRMPGLVGRGRAGEPLCAVCLGFECAPLGRGLKVLESIHDALYRWPGGPEKQVSEPWYRDYPPGSILPQAKRRKRS